MLNLIRMNLFRLLHTRGVIVIFVLLMAFGVCNSCLAAVESAEAIEELRKMEKEGAAGSGSGEDGGAVQGSDGVPGANGVTMQGSDGVSDADGAEGQGSDGVSGADGAEGQGSDGALGADESRKQGSDAVLGAAEAEGQGSDTALGADESRKQGSDAAPGAGESRKQGSDAAPDAAEAEKQETDGSADMDGDGSQEKGPENGEPGVLYDFGYEMGQKQMEVGGVYMATPLYPDGTLQDYLLLYCEELNSGILVIFFLIAAIIFFWADERNGFVKNIAGQTRHKSAIFLSKLLVIGIFVFASMLCYLLVEYLSFQCGLADADIRFGMERLPEACKVFATEYLLYMAYISGLLLLTEVTKSTAVSITLGILGITGFGLLLSGVIMKIFHTDFDVSKYYINTCITTVGFGEGGEVFRFALCIGGIFLVLYTALHVYWFVKRDIV